MDKKVRLIVVSSFTLLGILCISCGCLYSKLDQENNNQTIALVVSQKMQDNQKADFNIKLKNFEIETNTPLSIKIADYLEETVSDEVLANLKLDTSSVNVKEVGTYKYKVYYKKKEFEGTIKVIEKVAPTNQVDTISIKSFTIKKGTTLSTNPADYVTEPSPLPDEVKALLKFNFSEVDINKPGTYQYTVTFNNSIYTANITVTEDQENNILSTGDNNTKTEENKTTTTETVTPTPSQGTTTKTDTTQKP